MTTERVQDIVGGMVTGNTETGITVTYDDSDGTLDFVVGTLNQDTTGNAATATALQTARNIGGVSFDGTGNIDLAGVNTSGNQDTSGNAATATALATGRNFSITGDITASAISFDGTGNVALSASIDANTVGISELNVSDGSNGQVLTTDGAGNLSFSSVSGTTINNNADNRIITGSGTANTLEGEATFTFDGTNLIVGTVAAGSSTATPVELNLGSTFADAVGNAKTKLKLFEDSSANVYGFGVSNNLLEYHVAASGNHAFYVNDSEKIRIDSSGNLGIGTATGDVRSDGVAARTYVSIIGTANRGVLNIGSTASAGADGGKLTFVNGTNALGEIYVDPDSGSETNGFMVFSTSNSERMRITSAGKVGIGETSPDSILHLKNTATDGVAGISMENDARRFAINVHGGLSDGLAVYDAGAGATRVFLASTGRVGIGNDVTSPNAGLVVTNADIRCTAAAVANDANSISMSQESANNSYIVSRGNSTSERGNIYLVVSRSNGGGGIAGLVVNNDGSVSKNSGSFKIDHPLESKKDTHHLVHSFVEAPQADNIYRGVVQLENGTATINLDTVSGMTEGTFVALNTNTSCFTSNETDWDSVKGSITGNILTIACQNSSSTANVSWLVIGERQDQHMLDNDWTDDSGKVIVEPLKNIGE